MADAVLSIDAEVEAAVAKLEQVNKTLLGVVSTVKSSSPIYDAYGKQVSTALDKVDTAQKNTSKSTGILDGTIGKLASAFTIASLIDKTAGALMAMGKEVLSNASYILDLKESTGLTTETLQRFAYVEAQTGTQTGLLAKASFDLGVKLAGGGSSVKSAVDALGLSWVELQGKSPDQKFKLVTDALRNMEDQEKRNSLAIQLTGKSWKEVAPAVEADIEKIGRAARIVAEKDLQAIAEAQAAWRGFYKNALSGLEEYLGKLVSGETRLGALTKDGLALAKQLEAGTINYGDAMLVLNERQRLAASGAIKLGQDIKLSGETAKPTVDVLKAAEGQLKLLTKEQLTQISTLQRLGRSEDEIRDTIMVGNTAKQLSADAYSLLKERQDAATEATEDANRRLEERRAIAEKVRLADVALSAELQKQILVLQAKGLSEKEIATHLKVNETQVGKVIDAEKLRTKVIEEQAESAVKAAKTQADLAAAERTRIEKDGVERIQKAEQLFAALENNERQLALMQTSGHERRLLELAQSEAAEIASLHKTHDATAKETRDVEALIRQRYQLERDWANATASTIVGRMQQQGVQTRSQQEATVAALKRDFEQMKASGEYTFAELEAAERRWRDASNDMANRGVKRFLGHMDDMLNMAAAFASGVGGKFGEVAGKVIGVAKDVGSMASSFAAGDWIGGATKALNLLGKAVASIFPGNETKKAREEFAAGMDLTLDQLYKKLQSMGAEGQRLANTALNVIGKHDEAGNKRWMNEVTAFFGSHQESLERERELIDEATVSWEEAEELVKKYGIATTNSGKALEQSKLNDQTKDLAAEWRKLVLAGLDVTDVTTGMADEMQAYIDRARSMGLEIPEAMRAPMEEMLKLGLLTEANGEKMKDLGGIRFSETPVDRLVKKLDELLSKIFGLGSDAEIANKKVADAFDNTRLSVIRVGNAIHDLPSTIPITVKWDAGEFPGMPGGAGAGGSDGGVPAFSKGSDGIRDFGPRTLAWLHGREGVFTEAQITAIVQQAGRYGVGAVPSVATGMTFAAGRVDQTQPIIINAPVDASGSMFQDRRSMKELAGIVADEIASKYRGSFPVGVR